MISSTQDVHNVDLDSLDPDVSVNSIQFQEGMSKRGLQAFLHMLPRDQHLDKARAKCDAFAKKIETATAEATVSSLQGFGTIEEGDDFDEEEEDTTDAGTDEGLTNAWQYKVSVQKERLGAPMSSKVSSGSKAYCHSYDLSGKMEDQHSPNWLDENDHIAVANCACSKCPTFSCQQSRSCAIGFYQNCVKHIQEKVAERPNTVVRMLLMNAPVKTISIALPLLLSYIREEALPVVFLISVRPWLRPVTHSVSFSTTSYTQSLISLRRSCDAVFTCEGFGAMVSPPPSEFSDLAGILSIRKVALQALSHFSDTTTNRRPPANRYGMKRDRRKMHIRMLHLPPEDFSAGGSSVGSGARSGAGRPKEADKAVKESSRTALQPGMGCSSNKRSTSSTASSLEF